MTILHLPNADIQIAAKPGELAHQGAELFAKAARSSVDRQGFFAAAISGGSTPRAMHRLLAQKPLRDAIPWRNTYIFWVDERMVPEDSAASNYGAAKHDFLSQVPIPATQVFPMPADGKPTRAASLYQDQLKRFFARHRLADPIFDLIFLGMGTDGHTASLFPGETAAENTTDWVLAVRGGKPNVDRLTLSSAVFNHARNIVFLVAGSGKAETVRKIMTEADAGLPAQRIQPIGKPPLWLLDADAASRLSGSGVD